MAYLDNNLMDEEKIIFRTKPHWIIFSNSLIWLTVVLAAFTILPYTRVGDMKILQHKAYAVMGTLALFAACSSWLTSYVTYVCSEYGVTNKRVLIKLGFIRRTSFEVLLTKIESIQVVQSILGRLLKFGTILIVGTGGSRDAFRNIPLPLNFRKIIQEQVELYEDTHR